MEFAELAALVGGLPKSAYRYREWWANERRGQHVQCRAWMSTGYEVDWVNLSAERVRFRRRSGGGHNT
jgi:hypothetical protein